MFLSRFFSAFLIISLCFLPSGSRAAKKLVMRLVAEVDQKTLSSRDVEVNYIVTKIMDQQPPKLPLSMDGDEFRLSLDQLIVESMVYNEAVDFGIAKITEDEVSEAVKKVKQKINESSSLKSRWVALDYSDAKLKEKVEHRLRSGKLLKYKADSNNQQISDDEAKDYFEKNRQKFGNVTFDNFKPTIKKFIAKKNSDERLREWFDVLKKKYKVKNLI